ncbi:MAG: hypothetical protein KF760_28715 [Candidatus Eremiobacteraeota bacterium]|nr:hypothetical protein [Candidatus Eremiobacteraeota bacterium]MCW5865879.1 hypothetical protein [Candidatus Eremiobacteraeota bacterium]
MSLQTSIENLSTVLTKVDAQVKTGQTQLRQAHDGLGTSRTQFQNRAQAIIPVAATITKRLQTGQTLSEQSLQAVDGQLQSLESEIVHRIQTSRAKITEMNNIIHSLTALLTRIEENLRDEQKTTEAALNAADQQSQAAFLKSRTALTALNDFVAQSLIPKLHDFQQHNDAALAALGKKVQESFVPALENHLKSTQTLLNQVVEQLKQETLKAGTQLRESQTEIQSTTAQHCAEKVEKLSSTTADSAKALAQVVHQAEDKLKKEADCDHAILESYNHRVQQDTRALITIPINLKNVLDRANIK